MGIFNNQLQPNYYAAAPVVQPQPSPVRLQQIPPQGVLRGRPVASIDEAKASQIDLDGSLNIFPDLNNKKIYTKQLNLDGTVSFNIFELAVVPSQVLEEPSAAYVTKNELNDILENFKKSLNNKPTTFDL